MTNKGIKKEKDRKLKQVKVPKKKIKKKNVCEFC